jgi:hypothetical protein
MWESSVQGLNLTESIAAEWKLHHSQSRSIIQDRKIGGPILQLLNSCNSCNATRAGEAMATWFTIERLRNIHG